MASAKRWVKFIRQRAALTKKELDARQVETQVGNFAHHMISESPSLSVNRWRREMSPGLRDFITKELHDELIHFGYDV